MDELFKGKWMVRYDPGRTNYKEVLNGLAQRAGPGGRGREVSAPFDRKTDIRRVGLSYPVLMNDKRWETINLTTSSLFLGSALADAGFEVVTEKQVLPATAAAAGLLACDVLGFTLFEDLMLPFKEFQDRLRNEYAFKGLLAAGGPMVTLNPLETAWHLPGINLLVRGEAEMVLPGILKAIRDNNGKQLLSYKGFLLHWQNMVIVSDLGIINRPDGFEDFRFNLDFLEKKHLVHGLELNISRGCRRSCIFCSAVQGKRFRQLPDNSVDQLLKTAAKKLHAFELRTAHARTVNINDDDILQDPGYAGRVFSLIKKNGFRLWGIQTSIDSFFNRRREIEPGVLDLVADRALYMENNPLVWLGTDAFLQRRGKKMAKVLPDEPGLTALIEGFEKRKVRNYHYWISSDHYSDWLEFTAEFMLIYRLLKDFGYFGLIAHSPFLAPYSTTPLYRLLNRSAELKDRVRYKKILAGEHPAFTFPLVERVETGFNHLNGLLRNEKPANREGFFDYLKKKEYIEAFITLYSFLKQERMDAESLNRPDLAAQLKQTEREVEDLISREL
jgi:hypothetical protein